MNEAGKRAVAQLDQLMKFGSRLGLERIQELLHTLGDPQEDLKVIHVAGTNGKGSVCRYIYEVLQANGYRTGLYTSPYIEEFNERIEYNGERIGDDELASCTDRVMAAIDDMLAGGWESPTEFEAITAVAVLYFHLKSPDFVILEVGLGGRGDSTNITDRPLVSVITSVSYDHMDRLGSTLSEIAAEKAGIIKPGCPVVSAVKEEEAARVIARTAYEKGCVLHNASAYKRRIVSMDITGAEFNAWIGETFYPGVKISMSGAHQVDNAVCALAAIEILRKSGIIKIVRPALDEGMKRAVQIGRFEVFGDQPMYILDGAHNQDGMRSLAAAVKSDLPDARIITVIGILADKAVDDILDEASSIGDRFIAVEPDNPRKLDRAALREKLEERGKMCTEAESAEDALRQAREACSKKDKGYDVILCAGSLYLIGELRRIIKHERR